ncbi:MAG: DM13 domain-containing protein [Candidatus Spechtbacterales bacterium]
MSSWKIILALVVLALLVPFLWWTLSPLFIDTVVDESLPAEDTATTVGHGTFVGADAIHKGSGTARIIQTPEGSVLRLEDFEVTNGPDLYVLLTNNETPRSHDDFGEYVELAPLKGNIGNQTYQLPDGTDPGMFKSAVIYCKAFSTVFATATLN